MSSNVTVYIAAPLSAVEPLLGDLSSYADAVDDNDGYTDYASLVEIETLLPEAATEQARRVAQMLSDHGIRVAVAAGGEPVPYDPATRSA